MATSVMYFRNCLLVDKKIGGILKSAKNGHFRRVISQEGGGRSKFSS